MPITKGSTLYTSYAHTLDPTMLRREHLNLSKFFECDCARCADPTELGTHMSSLKCTKCDNGIILSSSPLGECPRVRWVAYPPGASVLDSWPLPLETASCP